MHKAKACVIACIDFRFQNSVQNFLKDKGYLGKCDTIILARASRDLVKPLEKFHKELILRQIDMSVKLHDPEEIIVIDHQDCGGYAQDGTIPQGLDLAEDEKLHIKYARKAFAILTKKYPDKKIQIFYATLDGPIKKLI
jgi:carbonic anhydrase